MRAFLLSSSAVIAIAVVLIATVLSLSSPEDPATGGGDRPSAPSPANPSIEVPRILSDEVRAAALGGWVRTPDDEPVAGATVRVFSYATDTGRSASAAHTAATDRSGRFGVPGLPSGTWLIEASARGHTPGYAILRSFAEDEPLRLEVRVYRLVTLAGRVLTTRSEPVAGATLDLRPSLVVQEFHRNASEFAFCAPAVRQSAVSDESGAFRFDGLPPGTYDCVVQAAGMVPETVHSIHAPEDEVEILVRRGQTLEGTVSWPADLTLGSVSIRTEPGGLATTVEMSKHGARFAIQGVPPGLVDVIARGTGTSEARVGVTIEDGVPTPEVHLTLGPGTVVVGMATDADTGAPLVGVTVRLMQDGLLRQVATDERGWYRVLVPAGAWELAVEKEGYLDASMRPEPVLQVGAEERRRDFGMRRRLAITGRVVYPTGEPARAWVQVVDARRTVDARTVKNPFPPRGQGVRTDKHGRFRIEGVVHWAVYKVRAIGSGERNFDQADEIVVPAGAREVSIPDLTISGPSEKLAPHLGSESELSTVRGCVVDGERRPIVGAIVSLHGIPATTGIDGRFVIPGVRSGHWPVRAAATGFAPTTFALVRVRAGVDRELPELVLPTHGARVSGRILGRGAEPIPHARIRVKFEGVKGEFQLTSDDFGRYGIEGPSARGVEVTVTAEDTGHSRAVVHDAVIVDRVIDVILPRHATLTGSLTVTAATPATLLIACRYTGRDWLKGWIRTPARLEKDGRRFICDRLTAGDCQVRIETAEYSSAKLGRIKLQEGRTRDVGAVGLSRGATVLGLVKVCGTVAPEGLNVHLYELGLSTRTGKGGKFTLKRLPPGTWKIRVWPGTTGARPGQGLVRLTEGGQTKVSIDLN